MAGMGLRSERICQGMKVFEFKLPNSFRDEKHPSYLAIPASQIKEVKRVYVTGQYHCFVNDVWVDRDYQELLNELRECGLNKGD